MKPMASNFVETNSLPGNSGCFVATSLIQLGNKLFSRGFEHDAMAMFDAAESALQTDSEKGYSSAMSHLSMGTQVLLSQDVQEEEERLPPLPDLYQEDECDVGPRVLRTTVEPCTSTAEDAALLEAVLYFNRAVVFHEDADLAEARRLYQGVLHSIQNFVGGSKIGLPPTQLVEMGMRAHNNMGHICYLSGEEDLSKAHFEASIFCARQLLSSDLSSSEYRLECATVMSNWSRVSWMQGDNSDNLYNCLQEVHSIRSSLLSWDHVDVAAAHFNIAVAEYGRQRGEKAIAHLRQYLKIASHHSSQNKNDLDSIPALIYLLLIHSEDKEDGMSQELVRGLRTLQDKRQDQGPESPEIASVLNFIGTLLFHKNDFENALIFFQEELRLEESLPNCGDDISVSVTCNNIGRIMQELGKLNEAVHYYERALKAEYGDIHQIRLSKGSSECSIAQTGGKESLPSSANLYSTVWYNLGLIHDNLGSYAEAIRAFQMSLELRKFMLGRDHPDVACLLYNIGVLQMEQQSLDEASSSFREALRIRRVAAAGQLNDRHVVKTLEKLSSLHKAKGNIRGALEALEQILRIQESSSDFDDISRMLQMGMTLRSVAELSHATGDLNIALEKALLSVENLQSAAKDKYENTAENYSSKDKMAGIEQLVSSLLLVGSLHHEMNDPHRAFVVLQEAARITQQASTAIGGPEIPPSLLALREVTMMLATSHCAAQA